MKIMKQEASVVCTQMKQYGYSQQSFIVKSIEAANCLLLLKRTEKEGKKGTWNLMYYDSINM